MNMHSNTAPQDELPDWFVEFMARWVASEQPSMAKVHAGMKADMGNAAPEYWMIRQQLRAFERSMFGG